MGRYRVGRYSGVGSYRGEEIVEEWGDIEEEGAIEEWGWRRYSGGGRYRGVGLEEIYGITMVTVYTGRFCPVYAAFLSLFISFNLFLAS